MMTTLEARDLTCAYNGQPVLSDLSLAVHAGQVLALIGPNGAGKTTLLRAMARLLRPRKGMLLLGDQQVWQLSPRAVARRLALAPQSNSDTWPLTVEQVVALGRAPHRGWFLPFSTRDREVVQQAMRRTGLEHLRQRLVTQLSGGEQRRVLLARTLAQEPEILLLDEPTAHLDLKYQTEILELVRQLAHRDGLAVVITLHDLNQAALCADRLALLAEGRLLAVGESEEVLVPSYLTQAYGVPVVVTRHPLYGTPMVTPVVRR
jgi:iron complex transport system ATP-binding protein